MFASDKVRQSRLNIPTNKQITLLPRLSDKGDDGTGCPYSPLCREIFLKSNQSMKWIVYIILQFRSDHLRNSSRDFVSSRHRRGLDPCRLVSAKMKLYNQSGTPPLDGLIACPQPPRANNIVSVRVSLTYIYFLFLLIRPFGDIEGRF